MDGIAMDEVMSDVSIRTIDGEMEEGKEERGRNILGGAGMFRNFFPHQLNRIVFSSFSSRSAVNE